MSHIKNCLYNDKLPRMLKDLHGNINANKEPLFLTVYWSNQCINVERFIYLYIYHLYHGLNSMNWIWHTYTCNEMTLNSICPFCLFLISVYTACHAFSVILLPELLILPSVLHKRPTVCEWSETWCSMALNVFIRSSLSHVSRTVS